MKKKQTKHFVPKSSRFGSPACKCFDFGVFKNLPAWAEDGEVAKTRRGVTCRRCKRTRVFRKLK